jgi:predicted nucleic acid-binding protein
VNYFLDTSALIKRYIQEKETEAVRRIFAESTEIYVSFITEIETTSSLRRLLVEGKITNQQFESLLHESEEDFSDFKVIPFSLEIKTMAKELIKRHQLKTLDSIQLAAYLSLDFKNIPIVVYDDKLFSSAFKESSNAIKPTV